MSITEQFAPLFSFQFSRLTADILSQRIAVNSDYATVFLLPTTDTGDYYRVIKIVN